jgi:A/G-specific adenine glycosylase
VPKHGLTKQKNQSKKLLKKPLPQKRKQLKKGRKDFDIAQQISAWFAKNQADLPWRKDRSLYRVWLAEIMLQQTTRAAVIPKYTAFTKQYKSFADVAAATMDEVLTHCQGLGYYRRFRLFKKACEQDPNPQSFEQLLDYAGVGPYTAAAVASICFGEKRGVVDGNVERVVARLEAHSLPLGDPQLKALSQEWMNHFISSVSPGPFNEAIMELGQTICTPTSPQCQICPINMACKAFIHNCQDKIPSLKVRAQATSKKIFVGLCIRQGKVAINYRDKNSIFLKDTWGFPIQEHPFQPQTNSTPLFSHTITRYKLAVEPQLISKKMLGNGELKWIPLAEAKNYLQTSLDMKALKHMPPTF